MLRDASLLLLAVVSASAAAPAPSYWLRATPLDSAETELRDALVQNAFAGSEASAQALRNVSSAHPGTLASGLAQLGAGLLLLDAQQPAGAVECLQHPDVRRTALVDHALLALGRAFEALDRDGGPTYMAAADARPEGPVACPALLAASQAFARTNRGALAAQAQERAAEACAEGREGILLQLGALYESVGDPRSAAGAYDRLDRTSPASVEAHKARGRLQLLRRWLPAEPPEERNARDLARALALVDANRDAEAMTLLRALQSGALSDAQRDAVRVAQGRVLLDGRRLREAEQQLAAVPLDSPSGGEAAFLRARIAVGRGGDLEPLEGVATLFPGTKWGEEALLSLANNFKKDARDAEAAPYFRRLLLGYPEGRYADRAAWHAGWADYTQGRFGQAAQGLEAGARAYPTSTYTPGMLYWAGRARQELGQMDDARRLLTEVAQRFKRLYHGIRARQVVARLPRGAGPATEPVLRAKVAPANDLGEPCRSRVRQLLLIERLDEAYAELNAAPATALGRATLAWIEWRRARLRPAITAMKRAYPEWVSEAGDQLPEDVWRILFPIQFEEMLQAKAQEEGLEPALVAALICQESTFDAGAVSVAGARGLMQVMPRTGRTLARALRVRYSARALHDPAVSLTFGTHYLRQLYDRFGGRAERVLAAYNAGPERVEAWTAGRPDMPAEEFVESIPFTETRRYVMIVLANREEYRRLYNFAPARKAALYFGRGQ